MKSYSNFWINTLIAVLVIKFSVINANSAIIHHALTTVPMNLPYSFGPMQIPSATMLKAFRQVNPDWRYYLNLQPLHVLVQDNLGIAIAAPKYVFDLPNTKESAIAFIPVSPPENSWDINYSVRIENDIGDFIGEKLEDPTQMELIFNFIRHLVWARKMRSRRLQ